tara:strand:- start:1214 stop:1897 length:684 start_codon:yes stop_codon:yes gene_type:complete
MSIGAAAAKIGPAVIMAGKKLGAYLGSEGVKQAGKRALRDTILYTAAEQAIPRALGQNAPDIRDTLVRQASGNILAEGVTAGLKGRSFFGEKGMKAGTARKIGEVTGQIGGQAIAQRVLPGEQANPFVPSTYMQQEETVPLGVGPTTATGATKFTGEPEYAEVVRPSTRDLSNVQAQEALSERDKYEYRLKMAQIEKMPSTVMHMSPDSNMQSLQSLAQGMMRSTNY